MKYLEFDVKNMTVVRQSTDKTAILSGAVNYYGLHFTMDPEFENLAGAKACIISKPSSRETKRYDLDENGRCPIPNSFLRDNKPIEIRVVSGNMIGTPWTIVNVTESGQVPPEEPEAEPEVDKSFVQSPIGGENVPYLKASATNGLEYSVDGITWQGGTVGVPEVPSLPSGLTYFRKYGDWVQGDALVGTAPIIAEIADPTLATAEDVANKVNEIIQALVARGITTT